LYNLEKRMKNLFLFAACAAIGGGLVNSLGVQAAEHEESWEGFYVGAIAGASLGSATPMEFNGPWAEGEHTMTGFAATAGLQFGYNFRVGSAVIGPEIDINYGGLDLSQNFDNTLTFVNEASWNWFSTVRARAGLAVDNTLVYVTGGLAIVDAEYAFGDPTDVTPPFNFVKDDGTKLGLAAGAGVEIALDGALSVKGEYLYIGLPDEEIADFGGDTGSFTSSAHMLRVGLSYGF
jgi:outer membrane immunogenic protein